MLSSFHPYRSIRGLLATAALLAGVVAGPPAGRAEDPSSLPPGDGLLNPRLAASTQDPARRDMAVSPRAPFTVPLVVSSLNPQGRTEFTEIRVANLSDTATTVTIRFRDADGDDLEMPLSTNPAAASSAPVELQSTVKVSLAAHATDSKLVVQRSPLKTGWAEVSAVPEVPVSVSAVIGRVLASNRRDFDEIAPAPAHLQAWLIADNSGGFATELYLVNQDAEDEQGIKLRFRGTDADCEADVTVAALGHARVAIAESLPCSASKVGTVEIQGSSWFAGTGRLVHSTSDDAFARPLTGIDNAHRDPAALSTWTVSDSGIRFDYLNSSTCIDIAPRMIVGVSYSVHTSGWQRRDAADSEWSYVPGTFRTGEICAFDPQVPGQYRAIADITIGTTRGLHASANFLTEVAPSTVAPVTPVAPPTTPTAGARPERDSQLVGTFVSIPPGQFVMGSDSDAAENDETPLTTVRISQGFEIGKYELTTEQWTLIMGPNVYDNDECGEQCPVVAVSWSDVQKFLATLNGRDTQFNYRLPTEAEWEYAARAGATGARYGDANAISWTMENSDSEAHPVGRKQANAWGLHDMLGNVFEWVQDWHGNYRGGTVTDPQGPSSGSFRVCRGGSYLRGVDDSRFAARQPYSAGYRLFHIGFRLVRTPK